MSIKIQYTHFHFLGDFVEGYDAVNHVASLGMDILWRRKTANILKRLLQEHNITHPQILDLATGTGDMAVALSGKLEKSNIIGCDPSLDMLRLGKTKNKQQQKEIHYICAVNKLPFRDHQFDAVTCAFGMRNFVHLEKDLCEVRRLLKSSGILFVLDFYCPTNKFIIFLLHFYKQFVFPWLGWIFTGNSRAYRYLISSIFSFKSVSDFMALLKKNGFRNVHDKNFFFGLATLIIGSNCSLENFNEYGV